ncbi:MAG TPA: serine protease [Bacteroidales bacterium]
MTKKLLILLAFVSFTIHSPAQGFNPKEFQKSLVKVMVTSNGKAGICSGFIWKKGDWVVTSLHAMKPGGEIKVQYLDQHWRTAQIIKVNVDADLVLLQVSGTTPTGIVPLQEYGTRTLNFGEEIIALGYNSGSKGSSTRSMKKGFVDPETLRYLVPDADRKNIEASGLPSIDLDIIYLDGSLLPGYSGSPVYDKNGHLIGIGDGGLEGGASNVSWVIPAKFLTQLENSTMTSLPANFSQIAQHFSAEVEVTTASTDPYQVEQRFAEEYQSYDGGDFLFYYTKTRTLIEMYESSYDPENIDKIVDEFEANNLHVDYNVMSYDVYEDANNGIVVAIPEGQVFNYDEATNIFYTDMTGFPQGYYFSLRFEGIHDDFSNQNIETTADYLITNLNDGMGGPVGGFSIEPDYTYSQKIDKTSSIAYIMLIGNNAFTNADGIDLAAVLYITLLQNEITAFYSITELYVPVEAFTYATSYGIDCINNYDIIPDYCDYFESYMQMICGAHLTTFANKQGYSQR